MISTIIWMMMAILDHDHFWIILLIIICIPKTWCL